MNEDSADILKQALQYSSVLPMLPYGEDTVLQSSPYPEVQTKTQSDSEYCHDNQDIVLKYSGFSIENLGSLDTETSSAGVEVIGQNNVYIEIENEEVTEEFVNLNLVQHPPAIAVAEVHSDTSSGAVSDVQDVNEIDNISLQLQDEASNALSVVNSGDDKPKRKRRRREKNSGPPPEPILPPCNICEDKSSGYHYGANTCEACKGFFRRTLKKKVVYYKCKCEPDEKEAWKRGPFKNGCPACRYERCLAVGMSKNAIKIGRYTLDHRTNNIKKVKSIEEIDSLITTLALSLPETSPSASGIDLLNLEEDLNMLASTGNLAELLIEPWSPSDEGPQSAKRQKVSDPGPQQNSNPDLPFCDQDQRSTMSLKEIDSMLKVLTEAHTKFRIVGRNSEPTEIIRKRQREYSEKYHLKKQLFGNMQILSKEEYRDFYNATGMDIDGRLEQVRAAFKFYEGSVAQIAGFAQAIPGFKQLSLDDQATLVKASRVESTLIRVYKHMMRNIDTERRVFTTPWGTHLHVDEMQKWLPLDVILVRRKMGKQLLELNLTDQEDSVLRAIKVVFSDRSQLDDPKQVDAIQEKLVTCLRYLLSIRPGGPGTLLYKIFNVLTNLRELTDKEFDLAKRFFVDFPMLSLNNYHLLKELIS